MTTNAAYDAEANADDEPRDPRIVYWTGRQWCVTSYGLETIVDGHYDIGADYLGHLSEGGGDPVAEQFRHVATSHSWVDVEDFAAAFAMALIIHQGRYTPLPDGAFLNALADVRRVCWMRDWRRHDGQMKGTFEVVDDLMAAGDAADERETEMPFQLVTDPHPATYEEERRLVDRWNGPGNG